MIKLLIISLAIATSACSSKAKLTPTQKYDTKTVNIMQQVELSNMQKHGFCEGDKLQSYIETKYYYQFTCSDGRNFMLRKDR